MSPTTLRRFLQSHQDFRRASLFGILLPNPWLLVTATHDRDFINRHLIPATATIEEGSIWDITQPDATIVLTQRNRAVTTKIYDWVARHRDDPWRGLEAIVARDLNDPSAHEALLPTTIGQYITILGPPIWVWADTDLVNGGYALPATTFNTHNLQQHSVHCLLGLVPLANLLTNPGTIKV